MRSRALAAERVGLEVRRASAGGHLIVGSSIPGGRPRSAAAVGKTGIRVEALSPTDPAGSG
jgi:hypothetical protein